MFEQFSSPIPKFNLSRLNIQIEVVIIPQEAELNSAIFRIKCKFCEAEFMSHIKERPVNDLIVHHQDKHKGKFLQYDVLEAEKEEE